MRFTRHRDPFEFSRVVEAFILEDPVGANVIATTLASLRAGLYPSFALGCVEDAGPRVAAVFVHTPPYPLVIACKTMRALEVCADAISDEGIAATEVVGFDPWSGELARLCCERRGGSFHATLKQRFFRLDVLAPPAGVPGHARPATTAERELVARWYEAFAVEAGLPPASASGIDAVVADGRCFLWIDGSGTPTSLASRSRATAGVARIGPVYTPPEARKRGHAGNLVAHVTSLILSEAAVPTLFTDLANPTSNALYTRLGYVPVADATRYRFVDA